MISKEDSYFKFKTFGLTQFSNNSLIKIRKQIFNKFILFSGNNPEDKVLDVGVSAQDHNASNFFEQYYNFKNNITALGLGDFYELENIYPGIRYIKGNGKNLPFPDKSFDWVFSHAVIEHVGNTENQKSFIRELLRVSRKGIFITSPNRFHPIEFHTGLPFLHYLPKFIHLNLYKLFGNSFYSREENLNLLFSISLKKLVKNILSDDSKLHKSILEINNIYWMGFPSNTVVMVKLYY